VRESRRLPALWSPAKKGEVVNVEILERHFERLGARVKVGPWVPARLAARPRLAGLAVDVKSDHRGEYFDIQVDSVLIELDVVDVQPKDRQLLMLARHLAAVRKEKFICGHDERAWFVAAVPDERGVSNVRTALEALKPPIVRAEQARKRVKFRHRKRRKTAAYARQGEWFFVPRPDFEPRTDLILRNEPIQRGDGSKPHFCELLVRTGGETVHVSGRRPRGLTPKEYKQLLRDNPEARHWGWTVMRRDAGVYVLGKIRHPHHKTLALHCWHLVEMNTESQAPAMQHVAFLD